MLQELGILLLALFTAPTADPVTIADADFGSESICCACDPEDMRVCHNASGHCPLSTAVPLMLQHSSHSSQLSSAEVLVSPKTLTVGHDSQYTPSHTVVNITRNTWLHSKNTFSEHLILCGVAQIWKKIDHPGQAQPF